MRTLNAMHRLLPLIALLLAGPIAAAPRGDEASARVATLERFTAALHADVANLERLLADDLDYCSFRGTCQTKREYIGEVKSGVLKYKSIEPVVDRVKLFADSAAVLGRVTVTATRNGVERSVSLMFVGVLAWREDRWQLTSWASTIIDPQAK
jgi:hypothetical protein